MTPAHIAHLPLPLLPQRPKYSRRSCCGMSRRFQRVPCPDDTYAGLLVRLPDGRLGGVSSGSLHQHDGGQMPLSLGSTTSTGRPRSRDGRNQPEGHGQLLRCQHLPSSRNARYVRSRMFLLNLPDKQSNLIHTHARRNTETKLISYISTCSKNGFEAHSCNWNMKKQSNRNTPVQRQPASVK